MTAKRRDRGAGTVRQRPDGRWEARLSWIEPSGRRRMKSVYAATKREALAKLRAVQADRDRGLPVASERLTVGDYLATWLTHTRPTVRPTTAASYENCVVHHLTPHLGRVPLAKLNAAQVAACYHALLGRLAPKSVQLCHAVLHRALEQAVRWHLVARNVADLVDPPRPQRREIAAWDAEQARRFLAAARHDRLYALYVLALTTGARQGELLALRWGDVDLVAGAVTIRRTLVHLGGWHWHEPKTTKGRRMIPLPALALAALKEHRVRQLEERLAAGPLWEDHDLIFCNGRGRPLARGNLVARSFRPLIAAAGVPPIRFHDLRHTCATLLLSLGEHPKVVQERLGHATIAVTLDVYSHVLPGLQRQAADKLGAALSG